MKGRLFFLVFALVAGSVLGGGALLVEPDSSFLDFLASAQGGEGDGIFGWLIRSVYGFFGLRAAGFVAGALPLLETVILFVATVFFVFWLAGKKPGWRPFLLGALSVFFLLATVRGGVHFFRSRSEAGLPQSLRLRGSLEEVLPFVEGGSVWASPSAARWMSVLHPGFALQTTPGATTPSEWRAQERKHRYRAAIFAGQPDESLVLLEHLAGSSDWQLAKVFPFATVFVRGEKNGGTAWLSAEKVEERYPEPRFAAFYFSRVGARLAALRQNGEAKRFFLRAVDLQPRSADARSLYASFLAGRKQWGDAIEEAEEALEIFPGCEPALQVLVQAELAAGRPERAWRFAKELYSSGAKDTFSEYLYARAANAAGAFSEEEKALKNLVEAAKKKKTPVGAYLLLLGQAYAKQGFAEQATASIREAIHSGELTAEQTESAGKLLETIEANKR